MPLASINLFALKENSSLTHLLKHINSSSIKPLVVSKPIKWVILPEKIETQQLLDPKWDLLLILQQDQSSKDLVSSIINPPNQDKKWTVQSHYQITGGVPSRLTNKFSETNNSLLHPPASSIPKLTGALDKPLIQSSSQSLTLSPELQKWVETFSSTHAGQNAVSMLNLLAFKPELKSSYLQYGKAFAESIGAKRGGNAKLVGHIVYDNGKKGSTVSTSTRSGSGGQETSGNDGDKWDEFALAHYPSITHFADMLASEDYQAVNQKYRVPSLKDTCILCTSEIEIEELVQKAQARSSSKL